jgi:signal transduction histidine kinase/ActR/RegA family two-component response regulator
LRSLRVHLLVLILGAMLPGALLTGFLVWRAFANNRALTERRLLESARVDASALDREFAGAISTLQALATSPNLDRDDLEAFYLEGRRVQSTQSGWYNILLLSTDGRQLVSTRVPWGEPLIPMVDPDSLHRLIATRQPVVGSVRTSPRGGPEHLFAIRVPVLRPGGIKYGLSAIVNVESLGRVVPRQRPNSEEWTRSILDPDGTIAVRTRGPEDYVGAPAPDVFRARIQQGVEMISRETTREGVPVYAAFSRGSYGWTAVVVVPRALLDAPLGASMTGVITGGLLLMLSGLVAVFVVSRRLSADLAAATTAADAVAEGRPVPPAADAHVAETDRLQRALATAASLLEKRARERDEEIRRADAARTEAEQANQTKDQFLAVLGHELRNPLAPALTALELMKVRDPNVFARERQVLERQIAHMARLVNDLLDVSRLARGKIQLQRRRFELREAVDRAVDMARPLIVQHRHALEVSVPATGLLLDADIDRIVQVLANLLTNAAKYTPPGGHVALLASPSSEQVVVVCEDDGPGVPPELAPRLFDPFAQGPRSIDRREGGLGLGLSLARTFTELHGGTIHVESRAEGGARFVVTLPLASPVSAGGPAMRSGAAGTTTGRRILIVDDNADACEMLRVALNEAGHEVAIAATGHDAIATAAGFQPDVGVLDIGLPGMDGYELARHLRATHPGIRLIALTGYGQSGDRDAAEAAGFDAHCAKPITTTALRDQIERSEPGAVAADAHGVTAKQ